MTNLTVETELEEDGRWLAEIPAIPGVMAHGSTRDEAIAKSQALALRVLADRLDNGDAVPQMTELFTVSA